MSRGDCGFCGETLLPGGCPRCDGAKGEEPDCEVCGSSLEDGKCPDCDERTKGMTLLEAAEAVLEAMNGNGYGLEEAVADLGAVVQRTKTEAKS